MQNTRNKRRTGYRCVRDGVSRVRSIHAFRPNWPCLSVHEEGEGASCDRLEQLVGCACPAGGRLSPAGIAHCKRQQTGSITTAATKDRTLPRMRMRQFSCRPGQCWQSRVPANRTIACPGSVGRRLRSIAQHATVCYQPAAVLSQTNTSDQSSFEMSAAAQSIGSRAVPWRALSGPVAARRSQPHRSALAVVSQAASALPLTTQEQVGGGRQTGGWAGSSRGGHRFPRVLVAVCSVLPLVHAFAFKSCSFTEQRLNTSGCMKKPIC